MTFSLVFACIMHIHTHPSLVVFALDIPKELSIVAQFFLCVNPMSF